MLPARRKPVLLEQFPGGKPEAVPGMRCLGWKQPREGWLQDRAADASHTELCLLMVGPGQPPASARSHAGGSQGRALVWLCRIILVHLTSAPALPVLEEGAFASKPQSWYQALQGFNPESVATGCLEVGCDPLSLLLLWLQCSWESPELLG